MTRGTQRNGGISGRSDRLATMDSMWLGERPGGRNRTGRVGAGRCSVCRG